MGSSRGGVELSTEPAYGSGNPSDVSDLQSGRELRANWQWQRLIILVFRGDPIDAPQYRHTSLFIEDLNQDGVATQHCVLEVVGSSGFFQRGEDAVRDPKEAATFVDSVVVATIPVASPSDTRLRDAIWFTTVNNAEYSWNCQNWVGDALNSCISAGLVLAKEVDWAIDTMVDLILQAPYEA
ncbi:hypothetical protein SAMD00023353_0402960 [Rosellinia necatrix]|uniref:Uncharacterized protein n=1 Tax=Rosellinia necatrix TaxID=77044 RepID=A0A1S7UJ42_ROSNE|nr:hypothetical protein SAMD00023353_0402960 [Rosellinia necatrix]